MLKVALKQKLLVFGILSVCMIFYSVFSFNSKYEAGQDQVHLRRDFIHQVTGDEKQFLMLFIKLSKDSIFSDTGFCAEKTKSNKYTFYFLRDNERNSAFGLPDWDENDIFSNAKAMGIDEIWKYNSENFYRCIFELGPGFRPQVFMLKSGQKNMTSSRIPDFAEIPMMINEKKSISLECFIKSTTRFLSISQRPGTENIWNV